MVDAHPTGSDLVFSFEKHMDSYECILYDDTYVSSKRVCTGRVETTKEKDGVVTHVAKEIDEKEEEYVQKERGSVGEEKGDVGTSAASVGEDRQAKRKS